MLKKVRDRGVLYLIGVALCKVVPPWMLRFRSFTIYEFGIGPEADRSTTLVPIAAELVPCVTPEERRRLAEVCRSPVVPSEPSLGWAFQQDERWVGGVWLASEQFEEAEIGLTIKLPEGGYWLFSAYVDKAFRRQGIYTRMLQQLFEELPSECQVFAAISNHNRASLSAHQRLMERSVAKVFSVRLLGRSLHSCRPKGMVDGAVLQIVDV